MSADSNLIPSVLVSKPSHPSMPVPERSLGMLSFQDCDLVLLNYARPSCTQQAIDYNVRLPWKRIIVADQQEHGPLAHEREVDSEDPRVIQCCLDKSTGSLARAIAPGMMESSLVCTHDDEYLVTEDGWLELFSQWDDRSIVAFSPTPEFSGRSWLASMSHSEVELSQDLKNTDLGYGAIYRNEWAVWSHRRMTEAGYADQARESSDKAWTTFWGESVLVPITGVRRLLMPDLSYADNTPQVTECKQRQREQKEAIKAAIKSRYDLFRSRTTGAHEFHTSSLG